MEDPTQAQIQQAPQIMAQMLIQLTADNKIIVNSSMANKTEAYGLLEAAKDVIREFIDKNQKDQKVQLASAVPGLHI